MKQITGIFLILTFIANQLASQNFHAELQSIAQNSNLVGMSVAIVCNAEISDVYHFGKSDIARNIHVNDSTMYRITSISKSVTATALMILYDQGLFDLDDNISSYMGYQVLNPNFPNDSITFRMLLSHTSSLQDGTGYSSFLSATYNQSPPPSIEELILPGGSYYTNDMWRQEAPGSYFAYSNLNFGLIGTLIEKLSGQRFDNFVRNQVLQPLGIKGDFNVAEISNINNVAVLYRNSVPQADNYLGISPQPFDSSQYVIGSNGLVFAPQGGLRISALDATRFMILHANFGEYNGIQILDSATVAQMHTPLWTYNGSNGDNYYNLFNCWGFGFHITTNTAMGDIVIPGTTVYGHPGEAYGLISDLYFEKEKRFGLVFITNGYHGSASYQWGNTSAFYQPEEDVFTAIKNYHFDNCNVFNIPSDFSEGLSLSSHENFGYFNSNNCKFCFYENSTNDHFLIHDLQGRILNEIKVNGDCVNFANLPPGIYILKLENQNEVQYQKVIIR
jgi:CubicO group peptidase (beta-lactamase class C family)